MVAQPAAISAPTLNARSGNRNDGLRATFESEGFIGPVRIFSENECRRIQRLLREAPPPLDWSKGHAATSRLFYELGMHETILDHVAELIGDDVMLWGASVLHRRAGRVHPWHTDIESSESDGGFVSVWIGLSQTDARSSLQVVSNSHTFGRTVQEEASLAGKRREERTTEQVEVWARSHEPRSAVMRFDMTDGEALFFDGRLWHGSNNTNRRGKRTALVLQYARPEREVYIPDFSVFEWPFQTLESPRPPCIMVRGTTSDSTNRIVPPPIPSRGTAPYISTFVQTLDLPLAEDSVSGWKPYHLFRGRTACMDDLSCHVSVLSPGKTPHPPHAHDEEELLVVLSGEAELVLVDRQGIEKRKRVERGKFAYYPAQQLHTLQNVSASPVTYLMFKWTSGYDNSVAEPLRASIFEFGSVQSLRHDGRAEDLTPPDSADSTNSTTSANSTTSTTSGTRAGFSPRRLFEGPTRYLRKLHCHFTTLAPGGGYPPHVDAYDVAILMMTGTVETLGRRVGPGGVIFYGAGEPHGMKNVGEAPATYLVFEFHGAQNGPRRTTVLKKLRRTGRRGIAWLSRKARATARRL